MISFLKDLPDWMMGTALAGSAWFAAAYSVLTPRAMENDLQAEVYPACMAQLEAEQTAALEDKTKAATREAEYARDEALSAIRSRLSDLADVEQKVIAYELLVETYRKTGLEILIPLPDIPMPSREQIETQRRELQRKLTAIDLPVAISFPPAPSSALMKTCACAAATAIAGKRTSYAISLASFRLVSPAEVSGVKGAVMGALKTDVCGAKPWELA
jgi:hypothetical protein